MVTPDDAIGAIRPLTGGLGVGLADTVVVMPVVMPCLDQKVWWATVVSPRHAAVDTDMVLSLRKRLEYGVCSPTQPLREQFRDLLLLFPPHQTVHLSVERTLARMYDNEYYFPQLQLDTPNKFCQPVLRVNDQTARRDLRANARLCYTKPDSRLSQAQVDHYRQLLRTHKSCRPLVVVLDCGGTRFLLDGHAKFQAYLAEDLHPNFLVVAIPPGTTRCETCMYMAYRTFLRCVHGPDIEQLDYPHPTADERALGVNDVTLDEVYETFYFEQGFLERRQRTRGIIA